MKGEGDRLKTELRRVLERHEGREKAITRRELRQVLNLSTQQDRALRRCLEEMKRGKGEAFLPVMSATTDPAGYYIPCSQAEVDEGLRVLRSYIVDLCITRANLKLWGRRFIQGEAQGELEI